MYIYCMYTIGGRGHLAASVRGCGYFFFFSFLEVSFPALAKESGGGNQACDQNNFTVGEE